MWWTHNGGQEVRAIIEGAWHSVITLSQMESMWN